MHCHKWLADAKADNLQNYVEFGWRLLIINGGKTMDQKIIVAIVLGVLVLIAAVQAFQFSQIKSQLSSGAASVPSAVASSNGAPSVPASLQNLPQMVGGC